MGPIATAAPDPRAYALLAAAGFGPELFNPRQHHACLLVERYAFEVAVDLCRRLGVLDALAAPRSVEAVRSACGFAPSFDRALAWLLRVLRHVEVARDAGGGLVLAGSPPATALADLRTQGLALDPTYGPAYDLLDVAAELYPRVARGEIQAERALFLRASLWVAYFNNANAYYALNNRVAARAAAARLPPGGGAVLEVGAGLGSATEALLEELGPDDRPGCLRAYDVTEPVVFFRRRAERALTAHWPHVPLAFGALDLNQPWAAQGVAAGSRALVWGVNAFHLARDLEATLGEAHRALASGGWLVVGEGVRPAPFEPVGAELPFQLLDSFHDVRLDPATRPTAGFLTSATWQAALGRAGFGHVEVVPDVARLRPLYPGFLAAAFCARRA